MLSVDTKHTKLPFIAFSLYVGQRDQNYIMITELTGCRSLIHASAEYTQSTQVGCLQVEGKGKREQKREQKGNKKGMHVGGFTVDFFLPFFAPFFRGILEVLEVLTYFFPFSTLFTCQMLKWKQKSGENGGETEKGLKKGTKRAEKRLL
jgi:hypothetical protein